jgi:hypothetical protein
MNTPATEFQTDCLDASSTEERGAVAVVMPTPAVTQAAVTEACSFVYQHRPWVGPLLEAAMCTSSEERRPAEMYTQWGGGASAIGDPAEADEEKHGAYLDHMLRLIDVTYPWLIPLLNSSKATFLVSPGMCCFTVQSRLGFVFDIPELEPFTHLTPFPAGEGEPIH